MNSLFPELTTKCTEGATRRSSYLLRRLRALRGRRC